LQEIAAEQEAILRQASVEERWQQWSDKAREQAIHKVYSLCCVHLCVLVIPGTHCTRTVLLPLNCKRVLCFMHHH